MSSMTKLKFRVVHCSSEDSEFPVTELLKHGPHSKGWQSARFQDFPQMIVLQFICPVRVQQLQFLSHQSKISSRIELYTYMPENSSSIPPMEHFQWKRLGYLSLDNNEKSGYQARELKSVYIDVNTHFLKVVLNKCHVNKYNMFNQVGLIAINALGEELGDFKAPSKKGVPQKLENDMEFDVVTGERLKNLTAAKNRAVENEDFDEAKRLKETIDKLKSVGYQLQQLEDRKRAAINNEDYESAKIIKQEIDRLRNAVAPPVEEPTYKSSNKPFLEHQKQQVLGRPSSRNLPPEEEPFQKRPNKVAYDEQVIPTHSQAKGPGKMYEDENPTAEAEPLGPQQRALAEPLIPYLGENLCQKLFSKQWQSREEGLADLQQEIERGPESYLFANSGESEIASGALGAIKHTIGDKVSQVSMKAMNVLHSLLSNVSVGRSESSEHLQSIVQNLLLKIGDNNARVRDLAEQTYITLTKSETLNVSSAVNHLVKPSKEKSGSQKHLVGKLNLLYSFVKEFQIDNPQVPFQPVVEFGVMAVQNSNSEVRNAANNLLMAIYSCVGEKVRPFISNLRPAQLELLEKAFEEAGSEPMPSKPKPNSRRPSAGTKRRQSTPAQPICKFCGKKDPVFASEDNLDIHYWKDCPMLVACPDCSQVVEILNLNEHMLKECELAEVQRQCPRCKEAVHIDEYEQHVEEQACLPAKPPSVANRCPLCHDDVDPGTEGWKQHILVEGCPNNDRSNF